VKERSAPLQLRWHHATSARQDQYAEPHQTTPHRKFRPSRKSGYTPVAGVAADRNRESRSKWPRQAGGPRCRLR